MKLIVLVFVGIVAVAAKEEFFWGGSPIPDQVKGLHELWKCFGGGPGKQGFVTMNIHQGRVGKLNWNFDREDANPCTERWDRVECEGEDKKQKIVGLHLSGLGLSGTWGEECEEAFDYLEDLTHFDISNNPNMCGPFPKNFDHMSDVEACNTQGTRCCIGKDEGTLWGFNERDFPKKCQNIPKCDDMKGMNCNQKIPEPHLLVAAVGAVLPQGVGQIPQTPNHVQQPIVQQPIVQQPIVQQQPHINQQDINAINQAVHQQQAAAGDLNHAIKDANHGQVPQEPHPPLPPQHGQQGQGQGSGLDKAQHVVNFFGTFLGAAANLEKQIKGAGDHIRNEADALQHKLDTNQAFTAGNPKGNGKGQGNGNGKGQGNGNGKGQGNGNGNVCRGGTVTPTCFVSHMARDCCPGNPKWQGQIISDFQTMNNGVNLDRVHAGQIINFPQYCTGQGMPKCNCVRG